MNTDKLKRFFGVISDKFFIKFFAAWFLSSAFTMLSRSEDIALTPFSGVNIAVFIALFLSSFVFCMAIESKIKNSSKIVMTASFTAFACLLAAKVNSMYMYIAAAIIYFLIVKYVFAEKSQKYVNLSKRTVIVLSVLLTALFLYISLSISVLRCVTYSAPNFDFGIFCNMYHNMKTHLLPVTTCERDTVLSHFAVHISPALYVFLPVYAVFPYPVTVAVCQIAAIYSGIIPFMLIAKKHNITGLPLVLLSVVFAASPVLIGGCMFDFHENCLLVPFLMWMFFFYEKKKAIPTFIFALLTLLVKEDAFIYIIVFAVYVIFTEREIKKSAGLIVMSAAYFLFACYMLKTYGTGIMSGRFDSMIQEGDGLLGIIKTVVMNPGYTIKQIFITEDDTPKKLFYFCQLVFPLAFMPFMTKKYSRLILVLPVFLNLLTDYTYQYDIFFQYSFGIETLLLYLSLINIKDMPEDKKRFTSVLASGLTLIMFSMIITPQYIAYRKQYSENKELYKKMDAVLEEIPEEKSIAASAFLVPKLTNRDKIYETFYHKTFDTDFAVLDIRPSYYANESYEQAEEYEKAGYNLVFKEEACIMIYEAPKK